MADRQPPGAPFDDDGVPPPRPSHLPAHVAALHGAIASLVHARRVRGAELDRVLAEVRELVQAAELAEPDADELGVLLGQVARWCVAAYDGPAGADAPEPWRAPDPA